LSINGLTDFSNNIPNHLSRNQRPVIPRLIAIIANNTLHLRKIFPIVSDLWNCRLQETMFIISIFAYALVGMLPASGHQTKTRETY
jgi:hypothetical protein